jgi:hypothetical protein
MARSRRVRSIDADARLTQFGVEPGRIESEPTAGYDWVVAVDVVEHVQEDAAFVRQLWRVARKGIYLTTPNLAHHPDQAWPYHVREYTPGQLRATVEAAVTPRWIYQAGGDVCGGDICRAHLSPRWEHQVLLALKRHRPLTRGILGVRDWCKGTK